MKKLMLMAIAGIALVACTGEKKQDTTVAEDTMATVETVEAPEVAPVNYVSEDGTREFEVVFGEDTATVKDVTNNVTYEMTIAVSASGAKYEDAEGNFFWTKGEEFTFGKGEENICMGMVKPAETAEAAATVAE